MGDVQKDVTLCYCMRIYTKTRIPGLNVYIIMPTYTNMEYTMATNAPVGGL